MVRCRPRLHPVVAILYVLVAAEMTSLDAWQPLYRVERFHEPEVEMRLRALPHDVTLHPGSSVSVRCWVRVPSWAIHSLHVGFYMYYDSDTTLPITSDIPGVSVRPWPVSRSWLSPELLPRLHAGRRYLIIERMLTIGWETYRYIPYGTNLFCCKASIVVNETRDGRHGDAGSGYVDNDVILTPTRKFYSSYFRVHKVL